MRTELIRSFSSSKLSTVSRSPSVSSINNQKDFSTSHSGLVLDSNESLPNANSQNEEENQKEVGCFKSWRQRTFRKKVFLRYLPIITWLPDYNVSKFISDVIAGLTVGLTILPQGLAYAGVAGVPPQYGLYSGFIGCFIYIFFGGTKSVTIGITAIMSIMNYSYAAGKPPEYSILLAFLTGIVTLFMGIFQLGFIVNFISTPVLSAFTSAASITIASTQIKALMGLKFPAEGFLETIIGTVNHIHEYKMNDTILSVVCIVFLLFFQKLQAICKCFPKLEKFFWFISTSRSAILIVVVTGVFTYLGEPAPVDIVGSLVEGLPPLKIPAFVFYANNTNGEVVEYSLKRILKEDLSALIVLPLLALMEHITIAKAFAGNTRVDASQEMISIGLSNLIGSFFSSIPITGSFSRTTVNQASGVETQMGGLITGSLVMLALAFLTPYFYYIPQAALASVIICAVIFMVDLQIIIPMWKSKRMDMVPWLATFLVSLLVGLEYGILIGFAISVIFLLYYSARPAVRVKRGFTSFGMEFILVELDRSLTFPSMEYISYIVMKSGTLWAHNYLPVVINCQHIQFADFTAAMGIKDMYKMFDEKNQELILWNVKKSIVRILSGVMDEHGIECKFCSSEAELEDMIKVALSPKRDSKHSVKITFSRDDVNDPSCMKIDDDDLAIEKF